VYETRNFRCKVVPRNGEHTAESAGNVRTGIEVNGTVVACTDGLMAVVGRDPNVRW
jgi:hypothetical protein